MGGGRKEGWGDGNMRDQKNPVGGGTTWNSNGIDSFINGAIIMLEILRNPQGWPIAKTPSGEGV